MSLAEEIASAPAELYALAEARLSWAKKARPKQLPPNYDDWRVWLILAGRGFGKTRTGAEQCWWWAASEPNQRIAVVAPTTGDLTRTIFLGESGFINVVPHNMLIGGTWATGYNKAENKLTFWNGSTIQGFPASEPERLRGPNHHKAWVDELAAIHLSTMQNAWDMLMFTMRLGNNPQVMVTTTPKPVPLVVDIVSDPKTHITVGSTYENADNLADTFLDSLTKYEGTALGRQEIHAEILDLSANAVFKQKHFKLYPHHLPFPKFTHVIQSWDTAYTDKTAVSAKKEEADPSAFSCWGVFYNPDTERNEVMLIDVWEAYMAWPELRAKALDLFQERYGSDHEDEFESMYHSRLKPLIVAHQDQLPKNQGKGVDTVVVESVGGGIYLAQELNRSGVPVFEYKPGRASKLERAHAVSHMPVHGVVWVPESSIHPGKPKDWVQAFFDQLCAFPFVKHDDLTDSTTQAWKYILDCRLVTIDSDLRHDDDDHDEFI